MKVIFGLSLSMNLLVLAMVGAAAWKFSDFDGHGHGSGPDDRRSFADVTPMIRALSREDRDKLRAGFMAGHMAGHEMGEDGQRMRPSRLDVGALLRADPFDAEALEVALVEKTLRGADRMQAGAAALANVIAEMDDAERAQYAQDVEKFQRRSRRWRERR